VRRFESCWGRPSHQAKPGLTCANDPAPIERLCSRMPPEAAKCRQSRNIRGMRLTPSGRLNPRSDEVPAHVMGLQATQGSPPSACANIHPLHRQREETPPPGPSAAPAGAWVGGKSRRGKSRTGGRQERSDTTRHVRVAAGPAQAVSVPARRASPPRSRTPGSHPPGTRRHRKRQHRSRSNLTAAPLRPRPPTAPRHYVSD
jgi:hypothetical protein